MVLAVAIVAFVLLGYPLVTLAGESPRFPTRDECVRPATRDADDLEVVYGRLDGPVAAEQLLARLIEMGFIGTELAADSCGRWKVSYDAIATLAEGTALAESARKAGFEASVEHEG